MNKFARHYLDTFNKTAYVPVEDTNPQKKPGLLLKALQGAVAGAAIGGLGGAGLGAYIGHNVANNAVDFYNPNAASFEAVKDIPIIGAPGKQLAAERSGAKTMGAATGGGIGLAGGALAGGLLGAVANPLFN